MPDQKRSPYGRGTSGSMHLGGAGQLKARVFRAAMTAAMLAAVVQSFGAAVKW
jgi:hypothetical protein